MFEPGNYRRRKRMRHRGYKSSGLASLKSWPISAADATTAAATHFLYGRHTSYFSPYSHITPR